MSVYDIPPVRVTTKDYLCILLAVSLVLLTICFLTVQSEMDYLKRPFLKVCIDEHCQHYFRNLTGNGDLYYTVNSTLSPAMLKAIRGLDKLDLSNLY